MRYSASEVKNEVTSVTCIGTRQIYQSQFQEIRPFHGPAQVNYDFFQIGYFVDTSWQHEKRCIDWIV